MTTTEARPFLTVDELAKLLAISRMTAYRLVWRGDVPRVRVGGQWRIPREELERQLSHSFASPREVSE